MVHVLFKLYLVFLQSFNNKALITHDVYVLCSSYFIHLHYLKPVNYHAEGPEFESWRMYDRVPHLIIDDTNKCNNIWLNVMGKTLLAEEWNACFCVKLNCYLCLLVITLERFNDSLTDLNYKAHPGVWPPPQFNTWMRTLM